MNRKEKKMKRMRIGESLDLDNAHLSDEETDLLYDIVTNPEDYNGRSETKRRKFRDWSSDGYYTRNEETTYNLYSDEDGVRIEEDYEYEDDDGQNGNSSVVHKSARGILKLISMFMDE